MEDLKSREFGHFYVTRSRVKIFLNQLLFLLLPTYEKQSRKTLDGNGVESSRNL